MTLIWLDHPVLWHSPRIPSGYNSTAMTPEEFALIRTRWHNWYTADWDYARTTVYFFCAGIVLFALVNMLFQLGQRTRAAGVLRKVSLYRKVVAAWRTLGSRQIYVSAVNYYSPPLSAVTIVAALVAFFASLTFAVRPYLWPNMAMGHSPPIATRSGWISIAILPFLLVLATKVNLIGMVTGVSHEKLQVYHRWTAWIMYITSLIHAFPFIVQCIRDGEMATNWSTTSWYWTGVAALVPQTWLVFMSWGPIRNRYYEMFKKLHFIAIFVSALFIHCNFTLTSWDYFWASAALYGFSWFARYGRTLVNGLNPDASFEALLDNMVKVTIPTKLKWRPGQHFFVRFLDLGIHAASSHPFTVASLAGSDPKDSGSGVIEMYARVHGGITTRLRAVAEQGSLKTSRVLLDGPYGGVEANFQVYDRVLLLGGGSGVTFVVPLLLDIIRRSKSGELTCRRVHLVWAVRTSNALSWFNSVLSEAVKGAPEGVSVSVTHYVTDLAALIDDGASTETKSETSTGTDDIIAKHSGRPDLPCIVREFCADPGTVAIATCGPSSFNLDVGTAVSECEFDIVRGKSQCSEIYFHGESYSW
ncbi:hypothetical protein OH76DRAFT_1057624 [Lentinus brumalis]|uniref:ferric-chelate reductase (NADPH) n=1 Tax=Lentinus brumalis TaxID=2498619 RepID=A0A371DND6_9APHY|nr:hypothetical protein OH76DRAFT_1057624 [Polyporus brumalis]